MNLLKKIRSEDKVSTKQLMEQNSAAVRSYNKWFLRRALLVAFMLSLFALILGLIRTDMGRSIPGYVVCVVVFGLMLLIFNKKNTKADPLVGMYILFTTFYLLTLYLSCYVFQDKYAGTALAYFSITPVVFTDKPQRVFSYVILLYIINAAITLLVKDSDLAGVDLVNCFVSMALGISVGVVVLNGRMENFEAKRQLAVEKVTDVLTTIGNRRKLFETMVKIESGARERPRGVLMLDIDHFKEFNDTYGHAAGDVCLRAFGELLNSHDDGCNAEYYRYGGEEFVAFLYGVDETGIAAAAEQLLKETAVMETGQCRITISIGAVYCNDDEKRNYEYWIGIADNCAYEAKHRGRNQIVFWDNKKADKADYQAKGDCHLFDCE